MPELKLIDSLAEVSASAWNALAGDSPFLRHEFLSALHETGCASAATGWQPVYLALWRQGRLDGAMPLYLKSHSRGEFVFDYAWADAFERHGRPYYPKLVCAVPFTPVTGPRLLAARDDDRRALAAGAVELAVRAGASSLHVLFPGVADQAALAASGFMLREGIQFHWQNRDYADFDAFLAALNHDKRKKIRKERRQVEDAGIRFQWRCGAEIDDAQLAFFHRCYANTYHEHGASPYLNLAFFQRLREAMPEHLLWVLAMRGDSPLACALNVRGGNTLFGRYWGAVEFVSGLHFETCYTQAIEYCIRHRVAAFEGGAQGVHKMARGLLPTPTWSAHWIADTRFAEAIGRFLREETLGIEHYLEALDTHTPFRRSAAPWEPRPRGEKDKRP